MSETEKKELNRMKKQWTTPEIETLPVEETAQSPLDPPEFPELS